MDFDRYQIEARKTAVFTHDKALEYLGLGLTSEAGEVASHIKKHIRDETPLDREALLAELGDVLWYVSILADETGWMLTEIAAANINKLRSRQARGKLGGSGDNR